MPEDISENAKDLIERMLEYRNDKRISFKECLKHPWFEKASDKQIDESAIKKLSAYRSKSKLKDAAMQQLVK